jgi:hypothetical protein
MERYPPLWRSHDAAVEPCLAEDLPVCRKQSARALDAARQLRDALSGADVPEGLEQTDRQFRRGLTSLADNLDRTLAAIDAGDEDALASLHTCCSGAGADVSNAVGVFNQELGLDWSSSDSSPRLQQGALRRTGASANWRFVDAGEPGRTNGRKWRSGNVAVLFERVLETCEPVSASFEDERSEA